MPAAPATAARATVLVVEDADDVRRTLVDALAQAGFDVIEAPDGMAAFTKLEERPDLVLLDLGLPIVSGLEVLAYIRERSTTPVIVVSSMGAEENRVRSLDLGADDYVTKPFLPRELVARVNAVLRRAHDTRVRRRIEHGPIVIDRDERRVWIEGAEVELTTKEFDLLAFLASSPGIVFTRDRLLAEVWRSSPAYQQPGTVTEHVRRLRQKVEADPSRPRWIVAVRGVGYRFERRGARPT